MTERNCESCIWFRPDSHGGLDSTLSTMLRPRPGCGGCQFPGSTFVSADVSTHRSPSLKVRRYRNPRSGAVKTDRIFACGTKRIYWTPVKPQSVRAVELLAREIEARLNRLHVVGY